MRKVANKGYIRQLAFRMIQKSGAKNVSVIIAILLSSVLFTTIFSVGGSMLTAVQQSTMRQVGGSDMAGLKYGLASDYETIRNDKHIKSCSYRIIVGQLVNEALGDLNTEVSYAQDANAKSAFCEPGHGRMPVQENEAAVSSLILEKLGVTKKLGQTFSLQIETDGQVQEKEFVLCGYWEGDQTAMAQQCFVSRAYQMEVAPDQTKAYDKNQPDEIAGYYMIDFNFFHSFGIRKKTLAMLAENGYDLETVQYGINWAYTFHTVDMQTVCLMFVILFFVLAAGGLIIYNIFQIHVAADIRGYGLLKTIGTTEKQLRQIIRLQALYLAIAAIPVGLVLGTGTSAIVFPFVLKSTQIQQNMRFSVQPVFYLVAAVFTFVTVMMGCKKPCRMAGQVSPIEAVTYSEYQAGRKKKKKSGKLSAFRLAWMNFTREKKKVAVVVLSLTLALVLMNGICAVVEGLDADKYVSQSIVGDFIIRDSLKRNELQCGQETGEICQTTVSQLDKLDGMLSQSDIYCEDAETVLTQDGREQVKELVQRTDPNDYTYEDLKQAKENGRIKSEIYGIDRWAMEQMTILDGTLDWQKFQTGDYAICYCYQLTKGDSDDESFPLYQVGDFVEIRQEDGKTKTYEVMATATLPYPLTTKLYFTIGAQIAIPEQEFLHTMEKKEPLCIALNAKNGEIEQLNAAVLAYETTHKNLSFVSRQTYLDEFQDYIHTVVITGGLLAGVLALIGLLNYANAMITGIRKRERECAMLEAVGMTKKQLLTMLMSEGVFYAAITVAVAVGVYLLAGRFVIQSIAGEIWFFTYHLETAPILYCFPFMLVFAILIPYVEGRRMTGKSVVERMRLE